MKRRPIFCIGRDALPNYTGQRLHPLRPGIGNRQGRSCSNLLAIDSNLKNALALRGTLAVHYGELWLKGDVSLVRTLTGHKD